jgi:hypothetical protein
MQMRYFVAVAGAVFIFVAVFIVSMFIRPYLPKPLCGGFIWGPFRTNNIVGVVIAPLAALSSYQGTMRHYRKKDELRAGRK